MENRCRRLPLLRRSRFVCRDAACRVFFMSRRKAMSPISRRSFLGGIGTLAATASASALLGSFDSSTKPGEIRLGYAAITWGSDGRKAIEDISAVGFPGIQLRADAIKQFQPAELRDLLQQHKLTFVALSSGDIHIDPAQEAD